MRPLHRHSSTHHSVGAKRSQSRRSWIAVLLLLGWCSLASTIAWADTATVTHNVNLRRQASTSSAIIRLIPVGESLDLISTTPRHGFLHVQTSASEQGWVWSRNVSVSTAPPVTPTPGGTPTTQGTAETAISSTWDKPVPNSTTFGTCGPTGNDGDAITNTRKNRTDVPADYHLVTFTAISSLTFPHGAPKSRESWSQAQLDQVSQFEGAAVSVEGYLYKVKPETGGTGESTNCNETGPDQVDWHIALLPQAGQPQSAAIVVETTPRVRKDHPGWTTTALDPWVRTHAHDHDLVRVSGWLMFDPEHAADIGNYRCTLWEVHPITKIEVFDGTAWKDLDH
jgi:hypothetical protein